MPEGSLTLRVKVPRDRGTRSIPLDLEVSAGETRLVTRTLAGGVTEKADGGLQTAAREIALPIVPERCSWEVLQQSELQGASGPQSVSRLLKRPKASRWSAKWSPGPS